MTKLCVCGSDAAQTHRQGRWEVGILAVRLDVVQIFTLIVKAYVCLSRILVSKYNISLVQSFASVGYFTMGTMEKEGS